MKFGHNVIHNGTLYKSGEEVPIGTSSVIADEVKEEVKVETKEEETTEQLIAKVKRMNKAQLLEKAKELGLQVAEETPNKDIAGMIIEAISK